MNSLGYSNGTTGGSESEAGVAFVTTSTQFVDLMYSRVDVNHTGNLPPLTVYIVGTIVRDAGVANMIDIKDAYDISVIGIGNDATFSGVGLKISRSSNIIVRNILFINSPDDGISIKLMIQNQVGIIYGLIIVHSQMLMMEPSMLLTLLLMLHYLGIIFITMIKQV